MGNTPHLVRRGTVYYFRRAVPRHLVPKVGRAEVSTSLRTVHRKEATIRCRHISNSLDLFFQGLRGQMGPTIPENDEAIKGYFQEALNWSLEFTEVFMDDPVLDADTEAEGFYCRVEDFRQQLRSGKFSSVIEDDAKKLLAPLLPQAGKVPTHAKIHACRGVLYAKIEQYLRLVSDLTGDYSPIGQGNPRFAGMLATGFPPIPGDDVQSNRETLQSVASRYRAHKEDIGDAPKTVSDFDVTMRIAYEVIPPDRPIAEIKDGDVRELRDLLKRLPPNAMKAKASSGQSFTQLAEANECGPFLAYATQEKRLRFFHAMLHWAVKEGYLGAIPGRNVAVAGKKQKAKTGGPYSLEDLQLVFSTPVYFGRASKERTGTVGEHIFKDGKYWVPLIGLYSGMRLGEIVQLQRSDIRLVDDTWVSTVRTRGTSDLIS